MVEKKTYIFMVCIELLASLFPLDGRFICCKDVSVYKVIHYLVDHQMCVRFVVLVSFSGMSLNSIVIYHIIIMKQGRNGIVTYCIYFIL